MATVYGSYMNANASISDKYLRPYITYTINETDDKVTVAVSTAGLQIKDNYSSSAKIVFTLSATDYSSSSVTKDNAGWKDGKKYSYFSNKTFNYTKSTSATTKTIKLKIYHSGTGHSSTATVSVSIPALTQYTITYNANGGTGAPTAQTFYYGKGLTLTSSIPTRSGYVFLNWNTESDGTGTSYPKGGTYSLNQSDILYAQWQLDTRTITYDANGGSDAPNQATVNYNNSYTIDTKIPTRTNYLFIGWATSNSATVGEYSNSANGVLITGHSTSISTVTSNITLYAVWVRTYTVPTINSFTAYKSDSSGNEKDETSGYFTCKLNITMGVKWSISNKTLTSTPTQFTYVIKYGLGSDSLTTARTVTGKGSDESGVQLTEVITANLDGSQKYIVVLTTYPDGDSTLAISKTEYLAPDVYVFDVNKAGKAIAFGQAAQDTDSSNNQVEGFFMSQDYFDKGNLPNLISNKGDSNGGWHFANDVEVDGTITANGGATVSNGMTVSGNITAANNLYLTGKIYANSSSNTEKYQPYLTVSSGTANFTRSSGAPLTAITTKAYYKYGRVVHLLLVVKYTTAVSSGDDVFEGTLTTSDILPIQGVIGVGYYGARSIIARIQSDGNILIRNASSSSVTLSSSVWISFTYISQQ